MLTCEDCPVTKGISYDKILEMSWEHEEVEGLFFWVGGRILDRFGIPSVDESRLSEIILSHGPANGMMLPPGKWNGKISKSESLVTGGQSLTPASFKSPCI